MRTRTNKLIAKYEGHIVNCGYDRSLVSSNDILTHQDDLKYHSDWNWIMRPLKTALSSDNQNAKWENLYEATLTCDIETVYDALVDFIETENNRSEVEKTYHFAIFDEDGKLAGIVKASNDIDLIHSVNRCVRLYYEVDDVISEMYSLKKYIGKTTGEQFKCFTYNHEPVYKDMTIKSTEIY